jgi:hypothetical protein
MTKGQRAMDSQGMNVGRMLEALKWANSYERLPILLTFRRRVPPEVWLQALGDEWIHMDNVGRLLRALRNSPLGDRIESGPVLEMMTPEELLAFAALPDPVPIYRGCYRRNRRGISWSTSREVAATFPAYQRYWGPGQPLLIEATVAKQGVLAVKLGRDECEVITLLAQPLREHLLPTPEA